MPRTRPTASRLPYTYCSVKRLKSGRVEYWRFRRDGLETKLPGDPARDPAAMRRYADLMEQCDRVAKGRPQPGRTSFEWLARAYLASSEFAQLAPITQADYRQQLEARLIPALGPERFDCITRSAIKLVRDQVVAEGKSARTANKVKQVASLLYSWAQEEELPPDGFSNPGRALKKLRHRSKSIEVWSEEEIALFMAAAPRHLVTAAMLALHTGQRIGDVVEMEWSDYQRCRATHAATLRVRQNKTGAPLTIACHPDLQRHLDKVKTRFAGRIVRAHDGKPTNANAITSALGRAVKKIEGMPDRSFHGLRYAACGRLEAVGCTVLQITDIAGHRTYQMFQKYASQRRNAQQAMERLSGTNQAGQSSPNR